MRTPLARYTAPRSSGGFQCVLPIAGLVALAGAGCSGTVDTKVSGDASPAADAAGEPQAQAQDAGSEQPAAAEAGRETGPDGGPESPGARFCRVVCDVCIKVPRSWKSRPPSECRAECLDDLKDCSMAQVDAALACTGGDTCPKGGGAFFCMAEIKCLLN